ncbi:hypothetical protein KSS87_013525, partial [Heliosperma pusillum]
MLQGCLPQWRIQSTMVEKGANPCCRCCYSTRISDSQGH